MPARELTRDLALSLVKGDAQDARVLLLSKQGLGHLLSGSVSSKNSVKAENVADPTFTIVLNRLRNKESRGGKVTKQKSPPKSGKDEGGGGGQSSLSHYTLPRVCLVDASHNDLNRIDELWSILPSAWWINASSNKLSSIETEKWPLALGELDLGNNPALTAAMLFRLSVCHVMRIKLGGNSLLDHELLNLVEAPSGAEDDNEGDLENNGDSAQAKELAQEKAKRMRRLALIIHMPTLWVINDDYVSAHERRRIQAAQQASGSDEAAAAAAAAEAEAKAAAAAEAEAKKASDLEASGGITDEVEDEQQLTRSSLVLAVPSHLSKPLWGTGVAEERVANFVKMAQFVPPRLEDADVFRLDVLLEDYLEQARVWNRHATDRKRLPTVDVLLLLHMPHNVRLDLSVLLCVSIMFSLPRMLLVDALAVLLSNYMPLSDIDDLVSLPAFVKTALVCAIRRIARHELKELHYTGVLAEKPQRSRYPYLARGSPTDVLNAEEAPVPTYVGAQGFSFIRPLLDYLDSNPAATALKRPGIGAQAAAGTAPLEFTDIEREILHNLPDVCTHSTRPVDPNTSYRDWLAFAARHAVLLLNRSQHAPSLTRAQVTAVKQDTYLKLEPILRVASMRYQDLELALTGPDKDGRVDSDQKAGFVPYGTGLPKGQKHHLLWNKRDLVIVRSYNTPWSDYFNDNKGPGGAEDESGGQDDENSTFARHVGDVTVTRSPRSTSLILTAGSPRSRELSLTAADIEQQQLDVMRSGSAAGSGSVGSRLSSRGASVIVPSVKEVTLPVVLPGEPGSPDPRSYLAGGGLVSPCDSFASADVGEVEAEAAAVQNKTWPGPGPASVDSSVNIQPGSLLLKGPSLQNAQQKSARWDAAALRGKGKGKGKGAPVVQGFAADASWDPAFVLAPAPAINQHNRHVQSRSDLWMPLHEVPILMHPSCPQIIPGVLDPGPLTTYASAATAAAAAATGISRRPLLSDEDKAAKETPAEAARRLLSEMGTLHNIRNLGGGIGSDAFVAAVAREEANSSSSRTGCLGSGGLSGVLSPVKGKGKAKLHPVLGALLLGGRGARGPAASSSALASPAAASAPSDTYLTALDDAEAEVGEGDSGGAGDQGGVGGGDNDDASHSVSAFSVASFRSAGSDSGSGSVSMADDSTKASSVPLLSAEARRDEQRTMRMRKLLLSSVSSTDVLKLQLRYPHLYPSRTWSKEPDVATNGRTLYPQRFPRFDKVVYTLDKKTLPMALMRVADEAGFAGSIIHAAPINKEPELAPLETSLFQNSELTLQAALPVPATRPFSSGPLAATASKPSSASASGTRAASAAVTPRLSSSRDRASSRSSPLAITDSILGLTDEGFSWEENERAGGEEENPEAEEGELEPQEEREEREEEGQRGIGGVGLSASLVGSSSRVVVPGPGSHRPAVGEEQSLALSADGEQQAARIKLEGKERDDVLHSLSNTLRRHAREEQRTVWVRPKAEPGRPTVYRVDPNEPEQRALPPRARLQSVAKPASVRLPLNASFRVTLKQPPMPEKLLPEEDTGLRDSVMRFDSGGRQQVW